MIATNYDIIKFCEKHPELMTKLNQDFQAYLDILKVYSNPVHRAKVDEAKKNLFTSVDMHMFDGLIRAEFPYSPNQHTRDIFRRVILIHRKRK